MQGVGGGGRSGDPARQKCTVYVNNIDSSVPEETLVASLSSTGKVVAYKMQGMQRV